MSVKGDRIFVRLEAGKLVDVLARGAVESTSVPLVSSRQRRRLRSIERIFTGLLLLTRSLLR